MKLTDGDEAMAVKLAAVRKVSSLTKSKPRTPGLLVVPVICILMYEVVMLFQASKEACISACAWASVNTGAESAATDSESGRASCSCCTAPEWRACPI